MAFPKSPCSLRSTPLRRLALRYQGAIPKCRCTYHSYNQAVPSPFPAAESAILSAAIAHVPTHGFTATALSRGARDIGYLDASVNLFPTGAFALVHYHLVTQRLALAQERCSENASSSINAEIRRLAWKRLHANGPLIHRWQEALALLALPPYLPTSIRELALLSDEILFLAGDVSVDTSWYTKRAALSAIYASSELFMTQDTSPDFADTEAFLHRRLDGAEKAKDTIGMMGTWIGVQGIGLVNILRSKGVKI
ncbi:Ubiquinone biosynthesis protein coq9, mitochondrial [Pseudocyphellaria aurata]|nr:Ubiquinone biosynthesis protein coq9, mitochondrial [Pseudocyphellaria aurata]